ncbi:MAG: AAA family ATPase [Magnetococcales bacterium]|nr:AAA family ATPase [Magnetococcales bacterium]
MSRTRLTRLTISGFRSIRLLDGLELRDMNVLIGPNSSGKSNFLKFFRLFSLALFEEDELRRWVVKEGGGNYLLFDGAKVTPRLEANVAIAYQDEVHDYEVRLIHAPQDLLFNDTDTNPYPGSEYDDLIMAFQDLKLFQFHDTSPNARIRQRWDARDGFSLKHDGANLGAFLYWLEREYPSYYGKIVRTLRSLIPCFADFEFHPEASSGAMLLTWRESDSDLLFGSHTASDGTLRIMCLVTLLSQPPEMLPPLLLLDEPELGLHPMAIETIGGLIRAASRHCQVILATQSPPLLDCFDPEDVIVVERQGRESLFKRLEPERLRAWLEDYTLSELWGKNVLGGKPGSQTIGMPTGEETSLETRRAVIEQRRAEQEAQRAGGGS